MKSLRHVQLFVTPWTAAYQAPPSMGFSRREYWSGVPLPSPDLTAAMINYGVNTRDCIRTLQCKERATSRTSLNFKNERLFQVHRSISWLPKAQTELGFRRVWKSPGTHLFAPAALFLLALLQISFNRCAASLVDGKFSRFLDSLLRV